MSDCTCNNFPAGLGNVTFGASVGVGAPSPGARLEVIGATADGSAYALITKNSGGKTLLRVRNDGPVQIGDTGLENASMSLGASVSENIFFGGVGTAVASIDVGGINANNPYLAFSTNPNYPGGGNTEQVRIDKNGKVGIGTASPSEKLEVNGNVKLPAGSWLLLGGGVAGNKGMNYDSAAKNLNVRNDEDGGTIYLTVKNGRIYFNQYGGANVGYIEVPSGSMSLDGALSLGGPINKIYNQPNVGIASNGYDDLIFNYGGQPNHGVVLWMWGAPQGGGDQGGGTQKMKLDMDGSLWLGSTPRKAIDSQGRCLYG